jgi:GGDEF domain-containing protein
MKAHLETTIESRPAPEGEQGRQCRVIDENPPDSDVKVTVSVGVAASDQGLDSPAALMQAADEAAYASKFTGKSKVTCWPVDADLKEHIAGERLKAQGR